MSNKGFTLIEVIMVIVLLGIIAAIALPRYADLSANAKNAAVNGALGSIRSAISIQYCNNITSGAIVFPPTILATFFAEGAIPSNANNGLSTVATTGGTSGVGWRYYPTEGSVEAGT